MRSIEVFATFCPTVSGDHCAVLPWIIFPQRNNYNYSERREPHSRSRRPVTATGRERRRPIDRCHRSRVDGFQRELGSKAAPDRAGSGHTCKISSCRALRRRTEIPSRHRASPAPLACLGSRSILPGATSGTPDRPPPCPPAARTGTGRTGRGPTGRRHPAPGAGRASPGQAGTVSSRSPRRRG